MGIFNHGLVSDGHLLMSLRDVWDFLRRKGINDSDIYAIQETLKDCSEYVSIDIYNAEVKEHEQDNKDAERYQDHLIRLLGDAKEEIDATITSIRNTKRLNRDKITKDLQEIYKNIWHNT